MSPAEVCAGDCCCGSFVVDFVIVNPFDLCSTSWAACEWYAHATSLNTRACLELVGLRERGLEADMCAS